MPALLWIGTIYTLSSIQHFPVIKSPISLDKIAHIILFFVLCMLVQRALFFQVSFDWMKRQSVILAFVITCLYGVSDEFHQKFVPGRTPDVYDVVADAIGGLFFLGTYLVWRRKGQAPTGPVKAEESI